MVVHSIQHIAQAIRPSTMGTSKRVPAHGHRRSVRLPSPSRGARPPAEGRISLRSSIAFHGATVLGDALGDIVA
uniref:Uncharacterized protein n=1 Tax=Oryza meridionalis TaxID=40149 RepID=A0A0E0F406_9ORYZ